MHPWLIAALVVSQFRPVPPAQTQRPGVVVQEAGTTKGRATSIDFASGASVSVSGTTATVSVAGGPGGGAPTTAQYWTGAADGTLSAEKNLGALATGLVLNTAGVPSAYAGATCTAPNFVQAVSASGVATCAQPTNVTGSASTATALAANGGNCGTAQAATGVDASGAAEGCWTPAAPTGAAGSLQTNDGAGGLGAYVGSSCAANRYATNTSAGGALTCSQVAVAGLSATGTPSATTYLRGDGTWSTPAGGGGSPGGSSGQLQYNNGGAFGGMARVSTDGSDLIVTGSTTEPSAPASGLLKLYGAQPHGSAGPVLPFWKGGTTQVDYRLFPKMRSADPVWGCLQPGAHGSTTITPAGSIIAGGATGTPAAVAWAASDERTRAKWVQYPSATTASSSAGLRAGVDYVWRGNAAGLGGWYTWGSFSVVTTTANQRLFVGLKDAVAVITATANPSAQLDTVYFGCDAAQTTIRICSNDNAGAATCTDLGANFPCTTANIAYDWALWAQPNGSSIGYYIRRLVGGNEASGTISTDLPRNSVQLGWDFWINNGGTAAASTLQFGGVCYVANP